MEIKVNTVYEFIFPYGHTMLSIPVHAGSQQEAAEQLMGSLQNFITDLSAVAKGATRSPVQLANVPTPTTNIEVSPELLELKIATLCDDIAVHKRSHGTITKNIKEWTGIKYEPANYREIIKALEEVKEKLTP